MLASHTRGDAALMRLVIAVRSPRSPLNAMRAISTLSSARLRAVTEPMNGLSL